MKRASIVALALAAGMLGTAVAGTACEMAGANTHVGTVTAVDAAGSRLTLKDAETGQSLTFLAAPALLKGITPRDQVAVEYAPEGRSLRATAIEKSGR